MSINNYILNLLNIKDENIYIITKVKDKMIENKKYIWYFRFKEIKGFRKLLFKISKIWKK